MTVQDFPPLFVQNGAFSLPGTVLECARNALVDEDPHSGRRMEILELHPGKVFPFPSADQAARGSI